MAATTRIDSFHGLSGSDPASATDVSGAAWRLKRADNDTVDTANPCLKPSGTSENSYRKFLKLYVVSGLAGSITELRFFGDGAWTAGTNLYGACITTYAQPAVGDVTIDPATLPYTDINASNWTTGSPKVVKAAAAGAVITATTGVGSQDFVVLFLRVANTATLGATPTHVMTYRWDET